MYLFKAPEIPEGCLLIQMINKVAGSENSWTLGSCLSSTTYESNRVYNQVCCMPNGNYELTCKDSYGDGWHGGYLTIDGNRYCESFRSGFENKESVQVTTDGT